MSIASELSCDVATAMLSREEAEQSAEGSLTEIVLEVHFTLRQLTADSRRRRRAQFLMASAQAASADGGSNAGGH